MRWFLLLLVGILSVGCSMTAPTNTTVPTVDVAATVDAAVEATRVVERAIETAADTEMDVMRVAAPAATPVVMTTFVPTPEPYVSSPGSVERGISELHGCLQESEEFRALLSTGLRHEGLSGESADELVSAFIEDKELLIDVLLGAVEEDSDHGSMLSIVGEMAGELCGPSASDAVDEELGMALDEARLLVGEFYDCLANDEEVGEYFLSQFGEVERGVFVDVYLLLLREEGGIAETLVRMESDLNRYCR